MLPRADLKTDEMPGKVGKAYLNWATFESFAAKVVNSFLAGNWPQS
jgi:hypothetical protein